MEKPKIITHEDAWFSYIAGLLEEIRDAVKNPEPKVIKFSSHLNDRADEVEVATLDGTVVKTISLSQNENDQLIQQSGQPKQKNGSAKRGGSRGKDV
jgi:hypothetical protein